MAHEAIWIFDLTYCIGGPFKMHWHLNFAGYDMPIGPLPQQVTNDLKSLDEMVSEFIPLKALRIFESLS